MAKIYLEKLSKLISDLNIESQSGSPIELKHFFSGAALYLDGSIRASWSPVGLAFKLGEPEVDALIKKGDAIALRYFPNGHVKKGYALFENPETKKATYWKKYFVQAIAQMDKGSQKLCDLKGLGLKTQKQLNNIGIFNRADLESIGAVKAFIQLTQESDTKPSLNFLYAMVGALEDVHWTSIAKTEKARLLFELEGYAQLEAQLKNSDPV